LSNCNVTMIGDLVKLWLLKLQEMNIYSPQCFSFYDILAACQ